MITLLLFLLLIAILWPEAAKLILKAALVLFIVLLLVTTAQAKYSHTPTVDSASPHFKYSAPSNLLTKEARDGYSS